MFKIFKSIIPEIKKEIVKGILLIVSNPVDILTEVALKLSGFPCSSCHWFREQFLIQRD